MKIQMQRGEVLIIGFEDSEDEVLTIIYGSGRNGHDVMIKASLPDTKGREGIIYHEEAGLKAKAGGEEDIEVDEDWDEEAQTYVEVSQVKKDIAEIEKAIVPGDFVSTGLHTMAMNHHENEFEDIGMTQGVYLGNIMVSINNEIKACYAIKTMDHDVVYVPIKTGSMTAIEVDEDLLEPRIIEFIDEVNSNEENFRIYYKD